MAVVSMSHAVAAVRVSLMSSDDLRALTVARPRVGGQDGGRSTVWDGAWFEEMDAS